MHPANQKFLDEPFSQEDERILRDCAKKLQHEWRQDPTLDWKAVRDDRDALLAFLEECQEPLSKEFILEAQVTLWLSKWCIAHLFAWECQRKWAEKRQV
jgi:hypothetical protein